MITRLLREPGQIHAGAAAWADEDRAGLDAAWRASGTIEPRLDGLEQCPGEHGTAATGLNRQHDG
jgi:hypothetical protein